MFGKKDRTPDAPPSQAPRKATGSGMPAKPRLAMQSVKPEIAASGAAARIAAGSAGKRAYEAKRAEKAGMGLEKWMAEKDRRVQAEREAIQRARQKAEPRKPGLLRRLLDRAHRPI